MRFEKQRILVAGGATGFGQAICERLAGEGAHVLINYRSRRDAANGVARAIREKGGKADVFRANITDASEVAAMLEDIARDGGVSALVHSASAPLKEARFRSSQWSDYASHWEVAVKGAYHLTQGLLGLAAPVKLESVVFLLSSVTLGNPPVEKAPYISAKYALMGLARALAVELGSKGVRVNSVSPGFAETPLTAHVDPRVRDLIARSTPLKRLATPEDVAGAVAYLLSRDSVYVTGANLPVAGGVAM